MKKSLWLLCAALATTVVQAQETNAAATATPEAVPATKAPAPSSRESTKAVVQNNSASLPLVPGPATVVGKNVNVRGQGRLLGEVLGQVTRGDSVTVIEEVLLKKSGPDEPSAWAKIKLPAGIPGYVHSMFVTNDTVVPRRLNVRGGPGENYSVIGLLERGDAVKQLEVKGDWLKIEAPENAYGFVAAQYLKQEPETPAVALEPAVTNAAPAEPMVAEPPTETAKVEDPAPVAAAPSDTPATAAATNDTTVATAPAVVEPEPKPEPEQPLPPRVVEREGLVRGTVSIQAPTEFGLVSITNKRLINYLQSPAIELDLARYKGMHVIVSGQESIDPRWPNTPVITIQKILVIE